jgi:hypothetical protein
MEPAINLEITGIDSSPIWFACCDGANFFRRLRKKIRLKTSASSAVVVEVDAACNAKYFYCEGRASVVHP